MIASFWKTAASGGILCCVILSFSFGAFAQQINAVPVAEWIKSYEVKDQGAPIYWSPGENTKRRGTVARQTRMAAKRRIFAPGCPTDVWIETLDGLFICEDFVVPSPLPPSGLPQPVITEEGKLPFDYAFIQTDGTRAFAHPSDYLLDEYHQALGEGFGIVVTATKEYNGKTFVRTRGHLWIERDQVRYARGSPYAGEMIGVNSSADIAWVKRDRIKLFAKPNGKVVNRLSKRTIVNIAKTRGPWAKTTSGQWLLASDIAQLERAPVPKSVRPDERWIDINVSEQVLTAYEGNTPVFATLVSTGRNNKTHQTPKGEFRIWVKLAYSDMDDVPRTDVSKNYSIQNVPWVQYFEGANGLHAAFWHDDFGERRSHGCVNLAPKDAKFLFGFTRPALPDGWQAIVPVEGDRPTLIRVR